MIEQPDILKMFTILGIIIFLGFIAWFISLLTK